MRGFWGLMGAYWFSERWKEAWGLAAIIVVLTALSAMASVWFAEASGDLISAIAFLHHPQNPSNLRALLSSAATLVAIVVLKEIGFIAVRHYFSTTLHRKWRAWLDERFNSAILDCNHTHFHLQNGAAEGTPSTTAVPDTLGGAGVQFAPKDLEYAAEMLGELTYNDALRTQVIAGQRRRLADFSDDRIRKELERLTLS